MRRTNFAFVVVAAIALLAMSQVRAAVKVESEEPAESNAETPGPAESKAVPGERSVAFRTIANTFITASPSNALDLTGVKLGGRQTFTLVDVTGGELADGHEVRIRYTPRSGKPSYWVENKLGIRRGHSSDVFKIKRVGAKVALVTATGKFVAPPTVANALGVTDRPEGALLFDILDTSTKVSILKPADQPAPEKSEAAP
jgi:hypothetical protein